KILRFVLFSSILLGFLLVGLYSFRGPLLTLLIRTYLLPELKSEGVTISFNHLDTDLLSSLTLSDISLTVEIQKKASVSGNISKATLNFKLPKLWHNLQDGLAASSLLIDGAHLRYTVDKDEKPDKIQDENLFAITLPELPYGIPSLFVKRSNFDVMANSWSMELDGLSSSEVKAIDGGLTGSLELAAIRQQGLPYFSQWQQVKVDFTYGPGRLLFPKLSVAGQEVFKNIDVNFSATGLEASGSMKLVGGTVDFDLDGKGVILQGTIKSRDLKLAEMGSILDHPQAVHGNLSLHSSFRLDVHHPEAASAKLQLHLESGKVADLPIDTLSAVLALDKGMIAGQKVTVKTMANQAEFTDLKIKLANLLQGNYWNAVLNGAAKFDLSLADWRQFGNFLPDEIVKVLTELQFRQLHLRGALHDAELEVPSFSLQGTQFHVALKKGSIHLPAEINGWKDAMVTAEVNFDFNNFPQFYPYLPKGLQELRGKTRGRALLSGTFSSPSGQLFLIGKDMGYRSLPSFGFQAESRLEKNTVWLKKLAIVAGKDRLFAHGRFPLSSSEKIALKAEGRVEQLSEFASLFPSEFEAAGDLSFSLAAKGDFEVPQGSINLRSSKIAVAGQSFENASLTLSYNGKTVMVPKLRFTSEGVDFRCSGKFEPRQRDWRTVAAEINSLTAVGFGHKLHLVNPVRLTYALQTISLVDPVHFDSDLGPLTITGKASPLRLELKLKADSLRLQAGKELAQARKLTFEKASLALTLNGSPATPIISGNIKVRRLHDPALAAFFDGDASFRYDDNGLDLDTFEIDGGPGGRVSIHGKLPIVIRQGKLQPLSTPLSLKAEVALPEAALLSQLFPEFIAKAGVLNGEIELYGTMDKPLGTASFKGEGLQPAAGIDWLPPGTFSFDLNLQAQKNRLQVEKFRIEGQEMEIVMDGNVNGNVSLADLLRNEYQRLAAELDLHGTLQFSKLAWIAERLSAIRRVDGRLTGDFSLQGPIQHPDLKANFKLTNGELRSSVELPALRDLAGEILIDDSGITFPGLTGLIGGAPATLSGKIILNGLKEPAFDLRLAGKNLLLYRADGIKVRADADLTLKESYRAPAIAGKLVLSQGYYSRNIHLLKMIRAGISSASPTISEPFTLFSFTDEPLKDAKFSLFISSATPFTVNTNLVKGSLRPELKLIGTGEFPQLVGEIYVDNARCSLPAGPLLIDSGLLRFRQSDPDRFYLDLSGSAKMMGYDITAKINGPYDDPTIDLSSYPPLGNEELLLLLLTGQRPTGNSGTIGQTGGEVSRVGVYLGRELLTSLFGKENIDDQSILERLQIDIGRDITRQGDDTIEAKFLLKKGFLKPNDSLYLTAEKDVWDNYNGGLRLIFRFR
ncbi:MAG: translocation/assembly module TamB domain-containing protein, partial [Deltaproteobacteria bacterium]